MRIKRVETIKQCDVCHKEAFATCLCCGKDFCIEHETKEGIEYRHGLHIGGSDDGYFCNKCDIDITNDKKHPLYQLHESYKQIAHIREEEKAMFDAIQRKGDEAEAQLKYFIKQTKKLVRK
jgi:hypothetical protein